MVSPASVTVDGASYDSLRGQDDRAGGIDQAGTRSEQATTQALPAAPHSPWN
jgi:hypothetical protein